MLADLKTGPAANHKGGWRHPAADLADLLSTGRYTHLARVLEHAKNAEPLDPDAHFTRALPPRQPPVSPSRKPSSARAEASAASSIGTWPIPGRITMRASGNARS